MEQNTPDHLQIECVQLLPLAYTGHWEVILTSWGDGFQHTHTQKSGLMENLAHLLPNTISMRW